MNKLKHQADFNVGDALYCILALCLPFDLDSQIDELLLLKFKYMSGQLEHSHKLRFKES